MTFNDNQMLVLSFEALNVTIAEFKDARDQLEDTERRSEDRLLRPNADFYVGYIIGSIRANFKCIARQKGFPINDINTALPYVSNYIVSNIGMMIEVVNSK